MSRPYKQLPRSPEIDRLVTENIAMAHHAALRAYGRGRRNVSLDDVTSAATYTLWRCACNFDTSRGVKFSTYAYGACLREARCAMVKADELKKVLRPVQLNTKTQRIAGLVGEPSMVEKLIDKEDRAAMINWLRRQLRDLGSRDAAIVLARMEHRPETLDKIGNRFGLTKERVRQIVGRVVDSLTKKYVFRKKCVA